MQRETLQMCSVVLPGQTSRAHMTACDGAGRRERGMMRVKEGGMEEEMGGGGLVRGSGAEAGIACSEEEQAGRGINTQEENKGLEEKERAREVRSCLPVLSFIPSLCEQPFTGGSQEIPPALIWCRPLNHSPHHDWALPAACLPPPPCPISNFSPPLISHMNPLPPNPLSLPPTLSLFGAFLSVNQAFKTASDPPPESLPPPRVFSQRREENGWTSNSFELKLEILEPLAVEVWLHSALRPNSWGIFNCSPVGYFKLKWVCTLQSFRPVSPDHLSLIFSSFCYSHFHCLHPEPPSSMPHGRVASLGLTGWAERWRDYLQEGIDMCDI